MEAASSSPAPDSTPALDDAASARRGTPVRKLWSFLQQEKKRQVLGWTHPWIAFLIVFGMIVIAVGASTSAISDIVAFIAPWVTSDTRVSDGSQMPDGSSAVKPVAIADKRANNYKPVLVTPFENNTIGSRADSLRDILEDVVFSLGGHPVERKQLDNIVQELQFAQSSGLVDPTKAAAIGRMVGARYVLIGSIGKIDKEQKTFSGYNVNTSTSVVTASVRVRLIDVETAAIVFSRSLTRSRSNLESKYGSSVGADMIVGALEDALKELYGDQALKRIIMSAG